MIRKCKACGKDISNTHYNRKFCDNKECQTNRINNTIYRYRDKVKARKKKCRIKNV
jgi:hypothetical protein